jgi:hypothetical protein
MLSKRVETRVDADPHQRWISRLESPIEVIESSFAISNSQAASWAGDVRSLDQCSPNGLF